MKPSKFAGAACIATAFVLAVAIYRWLPDTALTFGRLAVSGGLVLPLFFAGLHLATSPRGLRTEGVGQLLLTTTMVSLMMASQAFRMRGGEPPLVLEVASIGLMLLLIPMAVQALRKARRTTLAREARASNDR